MKKKAFTRRKGQLAALCAAALVLCPLGTGAGRLDQLTGASYIVEGQQSQDQPAPPPSVPAGKLNSYVTDGSIRVSDLLEVAEDYSKVPQDFWTR